MKIMHLVTQQWGEFELCSYVNSSKTVDFFDFLLKLCGVFILHVVGAAHNSLNVIFITAKSGQSKKYRNLQFKFRQCSQDRNLMRSSACGSVFFHGAVLFRMPRS